MTFLIFNVVDKDSQVHYTTRTHSIYTNVLRFFGSEYVIADG